MATGYMFREAGETARCDQCDAVVNLALIPSHIDWHRLQEFHERIGLTAAEFEERAERIWREHLPA